MDLVVNLQNEDLNWFCGTRNFIDSGVHMLGVGSRVTSFVFM